MVKNSKPHIRNQTELREYELPSKKVLKRHGNICGSFNITARLETGFRVKQKYCIECCNKCGFVFNFWKFTPSKSIGDQHNKGFL